MTTYEAGSVWTGSCVKKEGDGKGDIRTIALEKERYVCMYGLQTMGKQRSV